MNELVLGVDQVEVHSFLSLREDMCGLLAVYVYFCFFFFILLLLDACVCLSVYCVLQSGGHVLGSAGYCSPVTRFCWYWTYPVMGTHYSMLDASME